jgi:[ribosomal protein S5]-alanine N-acetyltransferase
MTQTSVPEIETERLLLRALTTADVPDLAEFYADPEAIRFLPNRNLTPVDHAQRVVRVYAQRWERPVGGFAIAARNGSDFLGICGAEPAPGTSDWEIEYFLLRPYWGQGFATEVVRALLHFAFDTGVVERAVAVIYPANVGSRRVLEHLGFVYEKDVNYIEMTGDTSMEVESPMLQYFVLPRDQFTPGAAAYRVSGAGV